MRSMATPTDQNDMMNSTTATAIAVGPIVLEHVDEVEAAALLRERRGAHQHHAEPGNATVRSDPASDLPSHPPKIGP